MTTTKQTDMFPDQLKNSEVVKLANTQLRLEDQVKKAEDALSLLRESLKNVAEVLLPNAMLEVGVAELKLENGAKISLKPFVNATIVDKPTFFTFLEANNLGSIVKHEIVHTFGKNENDKCKELLTVLQHAGITEFEDKETVHAQTLQATIKENDLSDTPIEWPGEETIKIYRGQKAVIKKG